MAYQQGPAQGQQYYAQSQQQPAQQQQAYGRGTVPSFIASQEQSYALQQQQHAHRQAYEQQQLQQQQQARDHALFGARPPVAPTQYVVFDRRPQFRKDTLEKAQAAKLKLEHYYQKAVQEAIERNTR